MPTQRMLDLARNRVVGRVLREAREDAGLSLAEVHRITSGRVHKGTLSMYESGERTVKVERLLDLARLYRVPPDVLLSVMEKRCQR